jgi:hypothetical protein
MGLITDHAFWELQSGNLALFWSDSWQQILALQTDPTMSTLITHMKEVGLIKVADYWNVAQNGDIWRTWKNTHEALNIPNEINIQPLLTHLDTRKILNQ